MRSLLPRLLFCFLFALLANIGFAQEATHRSRADKGQTSGFTAVSPASDSSSPRAKLKHRARSDKRHFHSPVTALSPDDYRRRFRNRFNPAKLAEEAAAEPTLPPTDYNHKLNAHQRRKVVVDIFGGRA